MSKTSDESWMMLELQAYLKRSAVWATSFTNSYRYDPFFRTQCNIIALQVVFSLLIMSVIGAALTYLYQSALTEVVANIQLGIYTHAADGTPFGNFAAGDLNHVKIHDLSIIVGAGVLMTIAFGYMVTRIALGPTRSALTSQKQFIGNIAHEIRTPLATIKMNTEVALLDTGLEPKLERALRSNIEELDRASDIINNLLTFNTLIKPEHIEFANSDLGVITDAVVKKLERLIERKHTNVSVKKSEYRTVWGNPTALEQIVMNIVKNAIIYTPDSGRVTVTIQPDYQGSMLLSVQDSGMGIAQKDLFKIFEPFYRGDSSRTRGESGSGLGLAIVSELVRLHHGKISVQSALKRGTTVTITLPCGKDSSTIPQEGTANKSLGEIAVDFTSSK